MAGLCLRLRDRPSGDAEIWTDRFARLLRRRSALAEALRLFRAGCANAVGGSGRMKFTLSWLKDHLETNATVDEIVGQLTRIGPEVEGVENPAADRWEGRRVGKEGFSRCRARWWRFI